MTVCPVRAPNLDTMERVAIAGLSLHETDVRGLERLRRPSSEELDAFLRGLADDLAASELVFLSTCNRVEVAFAREAGHPPARADLAQVRRSLGLAEEDELAPLVWLCIGRGAARHLLRVASSLESLIVGEDQILAQLRAAYDRSKAVGLIGPLLGPLFEQAFRTGREVRAETELARHPVSVVGAAVAHLAERFRDSRYRPVIAVIGAGAAAAQAFRSLESAGLPVRWAVNRTFARAASLAQGSGAMPLELEALRTGRVAVDVVCSATSAAGFVLDRGALLRLAARTSHAGPLIAVDLAVPGDLEQVQDARIERIDLEALRERAQQNRELRSSAAACAAEIVERRLDALLLRDPKRKASAAVAELLEEASELFDDSLRELLEGRLARLGTDERRYVERWARTTFQRLAHVPLAACRRFSCAAEEIREGETTG